MRKRLVVIAGAAVLMSGPASAIRTGLGPLDSSAHAAPKPSGSVTVAVPADPGSLDPQLTIVSVARFVDTFAYDTLVSLVGPGKVVSGLAQSWKVISPKKVQFKLHRGIRCSDGTPLTATVVKQNLDFVGNPANRSPLLGGFMPVGATVTANNRTRIVDVTTTIGNPFMIQGLALIQIVCSRGLANRSLLDHAAVGSGPYSLVSAVPGDHYTFAMRKGYSWGPAGATTAAAGLPAKVTLKVVTNETTAANLLLTGGLNATGVAGPERRRLNKAPHLFRRTSLGAPLEFFFNENQGHPTANLRVRTALVQAMNLAQIGTVATSGLGVNMTQLTRQDLTPCVGNSVKGSVPPYNQQAARNVLRGTGVKFLYPTDVSGASFGPASELAQQQLSSAGVNVTLDGESLAALQGKLFGTGDWDVVFYGIAVANPAQLTGLLSGPAPPNGSNFANIDNRAYGVAAAKASHRAGEAGCKYWLDGERALFKAGDVAPMDVTTTAFYGNGVSFVLGPQGLVPTSLRQTK